MKEKYKIAFGAATTPQKIFVFGTLTLLAYTVITFFFTGGRSFYMLLHPDTQDTMMDFFNSIYDAECLNPYADKGNIYPAICLLYYRFCGNFMNPEFSTAFQWRNDQWGLITCALILAFTCLIIYTLIKPKEIRSLIDRYFYIVLIAGTVPFWYCYERGNIILQVLMFLLIFIRFYKSDNKVLKEIALIGLALATAIKIYPVFFGLLLIKNKMWKESFRAVLYGIAFFFLPFIVFGGLDAVMQMIENIFATDAKMKAWGLGYKVNLSNTLAFISELTGIEFTVSRTFCFVFVFILGGIVFLFSKEAWKLEAVLGAAVILIAGFSYTYTLLYMVIPLVTYFKSRSERGIIDNVYMILFVCMFAPFSFGEYDFFGIDPDAFYRLGLTTAISSLALVALLCILAVDTLYPYFKKAIFKEKAEAELSC